MFSNPHIKSTAFEWELEDGQYKRVLIVETDLSADMINGSDTSDVDDVMDNVTATLKEKAIDVRIVRIRGRSQG